MKFSRIPLLLLFTFSHHIHPTTAKQPSAPSSVEAPLRELPWGQLNFLHTTDTHGWHGGHLQEPQYSADWGDYISFTHHLRERADKEGVDLLVIDSGDRVEGNGLYDASDPPGKYTFDLFKQQHIDVITSGNHELYINTTSRREYDEVVPDFKNSYIASNIDIYNPKSEQYEPFAPRFRKFTTKNQGINTLAFGFLFDFKGNANNTFVQAVSSTIQEQWFQDAIRETDVDLFLVAGHAPVRAYGNVPGSGGEEFDAVYKAIRDVKWDTPIVFFGGHTHIRDYRIWDKRAQGIESGRYMETIGFVSISGLDASGGHGDKDAEGESEALLKEKDLDVDTSKEKLKFERLYIDNNLFSFHHHSNTTSSTFHTELGRNVSDAIRDAREELKLDTTFGCAPHSFYLNRAPYPSNDSLLTLLSDYIIPDTFTTPNSSENPAIIITNSGALRFDVFKGPVTIDTTYLLSPFLSGFRMIKNVPHDAAGKVLQVLNNEGPISLRDLLSFVKGEEGWEGLRLDELMGAVPPVAQEQVVGADALRSWASGRLWNGEQIALGDEDNDEDDDDSPKVPGYTTNDDAGSDGDDTVHKKIVFYNVPNCVGSNIGFDPPKDKNQKGDDDMPDTVDIVYNEFIQSWILLALKYLGLEYGVENTRVALEGRSMTSVIREWVGENWLCDEER